MWQVKVGSNKYIHSVDFDLLFPPSILSSNISHLRLSTSRLGIFERIDIFEGRCGREEEKNQSVPSRLLFYSCSPLFLSPSLSFSLFLLLSFLPSFFLSLFLSPSLPLFPFLSHRLIEMDTCRWNGSCLLFSLTTNKNYKEQRNSSLPSLLSIFLNFKLKLSY